MLKRVNWYRGLMFSVFGFIITVSSFPQQASYPIDKKVAATTERTVNRIAVPVWPLLQPSDASEFQQYGYGQWEYGEGLSYQKRLDLMPADYYTKRVTRSANLLNFFALTDIHLTDKESPGEAIFFGLSPFNIISAYSPVMPYTTHVLDAAIQTVNALNEMNPFDFGISLGDDANNTQYNETRWFIDILDGKKINPDSGKKDDPVPGVLNDYQDEYQSAGLNKAIPWYQVRGNHDHLWIGTNPVNDYIRQTLISDSILKMGNIFTPGGFHLRDYYVGVLDGRTVNGDVLGAGPVKSTPAIKIPADANRRSLSPAEWMNEFFNTTSSPVGHGFSRADAARGFACYSFEPKAGLPIRIIVLDDTQKDTDPDVHGYGHGSLDQERYEWLVNELDKGQAEDMLMIIACHIPFGVEAPGSFIGWWSESYVSEDALIAKLNTYPNFLVWIAGHRHVNAITAFKSPDPRHPELGFWEIESSSLREFPEQFRTFEIVSNSDNTISIFTTNIDPAVKEGSLAATSRSNSIAIQQILNQQKPILPTGSLSYNAELVKQLTPRMQARIQK